MSNKKTKKSSAPKNRTVVCDKLLFGGFGMARTETGIVFVEGLLAGEEGEVELNGKKGGVPFYSLKKRLSTSEDRREPVCKLFGECGGCSWLDLKYDAQVATKVSIFGENLGRIGKIKEFPEPEVFTADELGYRNRVQFKVEKNKVGFYKRGSNELVAVDTCPLLTDSLNNLLTETKNIIKAAGEKKVLKCIDTGDNQIVSEPVVEGKTVADGEISVGSNSFKVSGKSFFQSNRFLVEKLANWCSDELKGDTLLDLFGGVGLFSSFHHKNFKETTLVEIDKKMANEANDHFRANDMKNCKAVAMSSERYFSDIQPFSFDALIVDPPRDGLSKDVRNGIVKLSPKQILYISCNPTTQARDLDFLVNSKRYKIVKTAIFDMYPNSYHMESAVLLQRDE
jgi:23S rRNA (uracil1939-C5)-methyltransferase